MTTNAACPHDGDNTFAYRDHNGTWKWHCPCGSTISGPRPNLSEIRAAIVVIEAQAERYLAAIEQHPLCAAMFTRDAVKFRNLADALRREMTEGDLVEAYEREQRAARREWLDEQAIEDEEDRRAGRWS